MKQPSFQQCSTSDANLLMKGSSTQANITMKNMTNHMMCCYRLALAPTAKGLTFEFETL